MITDTTTTTLADLQTEYQRLAFAAANGDKKAEAELTRFEVRMLDEVRNQQRRAAATAEQARQDGIAAEQAAEADRAAKVADHEAWLEERRRAFSLVQDVTAELVVVVKLAIGASNEAHAAALRRGVSPGRSAKNMLTDYIGWKLADAGLTDMPRPISPVMHQSLVADKKE